ncbi:MAG: DUF2254 family protein [Cardiobacteriaceae bacterium]|nr:DUF2254 family protein [Cardiobacteriaceae bacterium]
MLYRWLLTMKKAENRLWVTPALGALMATLFAFAAKLINVWLPPDVLPDIELSTLEGLLDVIASSMLAVSTFSLSIMVSAFSSASSSATPRATELVMGDDNTRMAIASFISAFIYAIIAKTALGMGFYAQNGRFVLFISTVLVLAYLVMTLIRWVHTLSQLGRMGNTLGKIYDATRAALLDYRRNPQMGAAWQGAVGADGVDIRAEEGGYLTHIDMATLQKHAENLDLHIHVAVRPGELLIPGSLMMRVTAAVDDADALRNCFVLDISRTYAQDPGWGLLVLSEAAQRALSPGINDPGTAVNVLARMMRLLIEARPEAGETADNPVHDRLSLVAMQGARWIRESFAPIARDGAGAAEVGEMLQEVLAAVWRGVPEADVADAARLMAGEALARAEKAELFAADLALLQECHAMLFNIQEK